MLGTWQKHYLMPKSPWYPSVVTQTSARASSTAQAMATATQAGCRWVQENFAHALGWARQVPWPEKCCAPRLRLSAQLYLCHVRAWRGTVGRRPPFLNSTCSTRPGFQKCCKDACLPTQASSSGKRCDTRASFFTKHHTAAHKQARDFLNM